MKITAENIDEWCFRYLEKDLSNHEIVFFEKELHVNSNLNLELKKWKRTFITHEEVLQDTANVEQVLYRFKHQIALLLAESVFLIGICAGLFVYRNTELHSTTILNKPTSLIESTKPHNTRTINKKNELLIIHNSPIKMDVKKLPEIIDASNIEPAVLPVKSVDSILKPHTFIPVSKSDKTDTLQIIKDSSQAVKKSAITTKKINKKRKYSSGSRLIPINNDL